MIGGPEQLPIKYCGNTGERENNFSTTHKRSEV